MLDGGCAEAIHHSARLKALYRYGVQTAAASLGQNVLDPIARQVHLRFQARLPIRSRLPSRVRRQERR